MPNTIVHTIGVMAPVIMIIQIVVAVAAVAYARKLRAQDILANREGE